MCASCLAIHPVHTDQRRCKCIQMLQSVRIGESRPDLTHMARTTLINAPPTPSRPASGGSPMMANSPIFPYHLSSAACQLLLLTSPPFPQGCTPPLPQSCCKPPPLSLLLPTTQTPARWWHSAAVPPPFHNAAVPPPLPAAPAYHSDTCKMAAYGYNNRRPAKLHRRTIKNYASV